MDTPTTMIVPLKISPNLLSFNVYGSEKFPIIKPRKTTECFHRQPVVSNYTLIRFINDAREIFNVI